MKVNEIIKELEYYNGRFPELSLREAINKKEEITPVLLEILEDIKISEKYSKCNYSLHIYAIYLLAMFKEKKAFKIITEVLSLDEEKIYDTFGELLEDDISKILASTFDGNIETLLNIIIDEEDEIDEYVRNESVYALGSLYYKGSIDKELLIKCFKEIISKELYDTNSIIANICSDLLIYEMFEEIKILYRDEMFDCECLDYSNIVNRLTKPGAEIENIEKYEYIEDVIDYLSRFLCFEEIIIQKHKTNNKVKVGRNEPCPCGSGKKYKKCCLEKDEEKELEESIPNMRNKGIWTYDGDDKKIKPKSEPEGIEAYMKKAYDYEQSDDIENTMLYYKKSFDLIIDKCKAEKITDISYYDKKYSTYYFLKNFMKDYEYSFDDNLDKPKIYAEDKINFVDKMNEVFELSDEIKKNYICLKANALKKLGDFVKAKKLLEEAFEIYPDFDDGYLELADIYTHNKYYKEAEKIYLDLLDKKLNLNPEPELKLMLGLDIYFIYETIIELYENMGDSENTQKYKTLLDEYEDTLPF